MPLIDAPTDWLEHSARTRGADLAVFDAGGGLTYAALRARAASVAAALADSGVGPGDPVGIDLPAGIDHAVALHGAILAGAVSQSLPARSRHPVPLAEGAFRLDSAVLEWASAHRPLERGLHRRSADPLTRVLSSGTSGEPKPVELTAANHLWSALASGLNLGVDHDDRWLCPLPLNHVGGLAILLRAAIYGTAAVIHDGFDVERVAAELAADRVTIVSLVSTQLVRLLDAGAAIERPRLLLLGGGPVPADVLEEALGRGARVVQTYGLTEAASQVCTLEPAEARERAGSAGRPLLGVDVEIVSGEIRVRGPIVAPGSADAEGWLHTGDLGRLDEEGHLWVEGRRGDLIVSGGENVRPERVEAALGNHPGIADVGVAGRPDREWGQIVVAHLIAAGAAPAVDELRAHAAEALRPFEVPKAFEFVSELPRTASGKLQRRLLD